MIKRPLSINHLVSGTRSIIKHMSTQLVDRLTTSCVNERLMVLEPDG
jgi:hypothetical protein